jgi:hypothetical protein
VAYPLGTTIAAASIKRLKKFRVKRFLPQFQFTIVPQSEKDNAWRLTPASKNPQFVND